MVKVNISAMQSLAQEKKFKFSPMRAGGKIGENFSWQKFLAVQGYALLYTVQCCTTCSRHYLDQVSRSEVKLAVLGPGVGRHHLGNDGLAQHSHPLPGTGMGGRGRSRWAILLLLDVIGGEDSLHTIQFASPPGSFL